MQEIINHIKALQYEYDKDSSAYRVLRQLEVTIPSLFAAPSSDKQETAIAEETDIQCPFCEEKGFDKPGLKYHIQVYCVDYMNTEEL